MERRCLLWSCVVTLLLMSPVAAELPARHLSELDILGTDYPRAFFFRATESAFDERRYPTYESWERDFDRLQGIIGKCLDEECVGRQLRNPEFFSRFKQRHPRQVVLLHFNGNARDPRYQTESYFAGHWIYRRATKILEDVPAESGETVIRVADARDFHVNSGRYQTSNDDIGLFAMTPEGTHDWYHSEQVKLLAVDHQHNTITVERGCYGTKPRAFSAGESRAAAHQVEGPWGRRNHVMWYYNFCVHCPRDRSGLTCADHLVEDLARWFGAQGPLAAFDGLEFDVMFHETHGDTNGDGEPDGGVIDGINQYGIGVIQFARQLRKRVGIDFILQGDGALGAGGIRSQRAWGLLNGIESEGWPNLNDWEFDDWSGGLNRHAFWQANARAPVFNYVNHKWNQPVPGEPGARSHPDVPFSRHRLTFAACQFVDAMVCYSFAPRSGADGRFGVWDELVGGTAQQVGWLGAPLGQAQRLALASPDLLDGSGCGDALAARISGAVSTRVTPSGVRVTANPSDSDSDLRFQIRDIPADGRDLLVAVRLAGDRWKEYPAEMARFAQVAASYGQINLLALPPTDRGMRLRASEHELPLDRRTGAVVQFGRRGIDGDVKETVFVHPPYRESCGYVFWTQNVQIPQNGELRFSLGMGPLSPVRSDGVWFQVWAAEIEAGRPQEFALLFEEATNQHEWKPCRVPLDQFSGGTICLKFVADCGPHDHTTTDQGMWADVRVVDRELSQEQITPLKKYMTWVNQDPFTSYFYFHDVHSPAVNLSLMVEGNVPITIESLAVYAHPDAIYRAFENGLVLANPSRHPYTFELQQIVPGQQFRRIQGTERQDPQTNNGQQVLERVTLGERDALFLMRDETPERSAE